MVETYLIDSIEPSFLIKNDTNNTTKDPKYVYDISKEKNVPISLIAGFCIKIGFNDETSKRKSSSRKKRTKNTNISEDIKNNSK